jgi:hypothetical protein
MTLAFSSVRDFGATLVMLSKICTHDARLRLGQGRPGWQKVRHTLLWTPKPWRRRALHPMTFASLSQGLRRDIFLAEVPGLCPVLRQVTRHRGGLAPSLPLLLLALR